MIGSEFEIELASEERDCDFLLTDDRNSVDVYKAWEAADDESVLIVEDAAPDPVYDFACEQSWDEVKWASEVERAKVKFPVQDVREETEFYLEEPPSNIYVDIGRLEAFEILERRGIEVDDYEDAWYYPRKNKAIFIFVSSDSAGETYRTLREVANLDEVEQGLVDGRWPDGEDSRKSIEDLQQEIYGETTWAEFEAGIIACWRRGITDYEEIAEALDSNYQTVTNSIYHIRDKLEMRAREQREIYTVVPEEFRPTDLLFKQD